MDKGIFQVFSKTNQRIGNQIRHIYLYDIAEEKYIKIGNWSILCDTQQCNMTIDQENELLHVITGAPAHKKFIYGVVDLAMIL